MTGRILGWLSVMLILPVFLFGCSPKTGKDIQPLVKDPPGTLVGVSYSYHVGMVWGDDFEITAGPEQIRYMRYFQMDERDYMEVQGIPMNTAYWKNIEASVLELFPNLQENKPVQKKLSFWEKLFGPKELPMVLDGGDETSFSLTWETPEGTVTVSYHWNSSKEGAMDLVEVLRSLIQTL